MEFKISISTRIGHYAIVRQEDGDDHVFVLYTGNYAMTRHNYLKLIQKMSVFFDKYETSDGWIGAYARFRPLPDVGFYTPPPRDSGNTP